MNDRSQNWKLILCVTLLGLTAWSAYAASAERGSPGCEKKVDGEVAALEKKTGRHPSNHVRENLLITCSEKEVGTDLEGLFAKHRQEGAADKEARCQASVKFVRDNGLEPSGRAAEELVKICLELPSDHDPVCGFPKDGESYSVVENQSCVTKQAGLTSHAVVAKAEKRARSHDDTGGDADTGTGSGTSAQ